MDHKVSIVSKDLSVEWVTLISPFRRSIAKSAFLMKFDVVVVVIVVYTHLSPEEIFGCMVRVECQDCSQICRSSKRFKS